MKKIVPKVYATRSEYLDPCDCGSMVGYTITSRRRLNCNVDLSDCNRKITWYFENDARSIQKIDKALEILTSFREAFIHARAQFAKKKTRKKPRV